MYEVFLNDRKLIIAGNSNQPFTGSSVKILPASNPIRLVNHVTRFLEGEEEQLILFGDEPELWISFKQIFRSVPAAGGIVRSSKGFLFLLRRGKWDLPKGKIDWNETPETAALREVSEETGLTEIFIEGILPSTWHIYRSLYSRSAGEWILKETKWFSMRASGKEHPVPETGEDIVEVRWFARKNLGEVLHNTYASLKEIIMQLM